MTEVQKAILDIFVHIQDLCKRNDIPYYAVAGTCLGAIRHHGFIPWDDDIDIAIPIQDFDRFLTLAESELPDHLKVFRSDRTQHFRRIYAKIHNVNTTSIEDETLKYKDAHTGVWVDVLPLASFPVGKVGRRLFQLKILYYFGMNYLNRYPYEDMGNALKKAAWLLTRPLCAGKKYTYYSEKCLRLLSRYPLGSTELTGGYVWWRHKGDLTISMDCFRSTVTVPFESTTIECPVGYDAYLTMRFGDYMQPPPPEKRRDHNQVYVDLNHSYKDFSPPEKK